MDKNKKIKRVLGMNTGHNGGCALCVDGKIVVAITEERLTRKKNTAGYMNALMYCLETANLTINDIDLVVFSSYLERLPENYDGRLSLLGFPKEKCVTVDHHLSHACSTFFTSPFEKASIFVYDGNGNDTDTESFYFAENSKIEKIAGNPIADPLKGIISAYKAFTSYFGWTADEAGKTMGLTSYGDETLFSKYKIYEEDKNGYFYNNLDSFGSKGVEALCAKYGLKFPVKSSKNPVEDYKDMAAWLQGEFDRAVAGSVSKLCRETKCGNVCLSGGGALNSVANFKVLELPGVKNLSIFPAANDAGQCVGNALYGYYIYGKNERQNNVWKNDYLGRSYEFSCDDVINKARFSEYAVSGAPLYACEKLVNVPETVALLISKGNIVGWFQGGSELGPRSLGHRSILCDPRDGAMKDLLNLKVKGRESFRPFAASVLEEKSQEYFDLNIPSTFMLLVTKVKGDKKDQIPAVVHVDGTCRIQTVNKEDNGVFYDLVKSFNDITGVPMVLNTSFNFAGEPIVETPTDAMLCFLKTKMDYLVINDILIKKL